MSAKWTFWAWEQHLKKAPMKLSLLQLANNANDDGISWYSVGNMAASCDMSVRTFQTQLRTLQSKGLLIIKPRANKSSVYQLLEQEIILVGANSAPKNDLGCELCTSGCELCTSRGANFAHDPNSNLNTELNSKDLMSDKSDCDEVIDYLNSKVGSKYKVSTKSHSQNINARIKDGHSVDDLKSVIDSKWLEWGSDPKMAQYLRPQTLFSTKNFEGYLTASKTIPNDQHRNINEIGTDFSAPEEYTKMNFDDNGRHVDE